MGLVEVPYASGTHLANKAQNFTSVTYMHKLTRLANYSKLLSIATPNKPSH